MVIFPDSNIEELMDILIVDKKIQLLGKNIENSEATVVDAAGCYVVPGLIDMHVHLREPGQEYKEDIVTGTRAAAAGGFTSIACMPNTDPVVDSPEIVQFLMNKIKTSAKVKVYPIGAITKNLEGKQLSEMGLMFSSGAVAFSDDGKYVHNSEVMKNALLYSRTLGVPLISHSEDPFLVEDGEMNEGYYSTILGLKGIPAVAEEIAIARDILLARYYGPVHIAHVSTKNAVEMIRKAKQEGVPITAETAPHYFWFTDEDVKTYNTNFKMKPPLRTKEDKDALIEGLKDGTIDVIATDHAPHSIDEKLCEFRLAAFGIIGLETALSATITKLYYENNLPLPLIFQKLTCNPARILNLRSGTIIAGEYADITIIDINKVYTVSEKHFYSKSHNSPFLGIELKGKVVYTFVDGAMVFSKNKVH
ncbi:MAG TPA: dihydroorotase [Candidatus Margulisbacteria bacterium]|nr:MAG: dihydroorotase [Candidatus Margulisbacteria bacterium GWE2_39_32]HCT85070.1 dihydroorotase [Candidatus Margulisiibacteriota bacterium]